MIKLKQVIAATLLCTASLAAHADNYSGWYVGGGIGALSYRVIDLDFDGVGSMAKVYGGYRFNPWVALEVSALGSTAEDDRAYWDDFEVETSALTGQVVGSVPLNGGFALFGKVGLAAWETETRDYQYRTYNQNDGTDLAYGGGLQFDFNFPLRLRAEFEAIDVDTEQTRVWGFTMGAAYRF